MNRTFIFFLLLWQYFATHFAKLYQLISKASMLCYSHIYFYMIFHLSVKKYLHNIVDTLQINSWNYWYISANVWMCWRIKQTGCLMIPFSICNYEYICIIIRTSELLSFYLDSVASFLTSDKPSQNVLFVVTIIVGLITRYTNFYVNTHQFGESPNIPSSTTLPQ